jgi:DNA replication and repair protein RecF
VIYHALVASHFRNLQQVTLTPHPRFNVLHGDNGQGKTNLLEAIYLLATLRSFRTSRIEELIAFSHGAAEIRARVEQQRVSRQLGIQLLTRPTRKQAFVDGKAARSSEYFGGVNVVLFAPEDLRLPKGPKADRRRFLDRAIWNTYPAYLDEVRVYDRILRSRNALLRGGGRDELADAEPTALPTGADLLDIYDEKLAAAGAVLTERRRRYLDELAPQVAATFSEVSRSGLDVEVRYVPGIAAVRAARQAVPASELAPLFLDQLQRDRRRDQLRGYTHSGPHADDVALDLDGRPAEIHASQGQTRAFVLALKVAEIQHLYRVLQDPPILLLDDVSSELDAQRNAYLFAFLRTMPCQVFITTTSPSHIQLPGPGPGPSTSTATGTSPGPGSERCDFLVHAGQVFGPGSLASDAGAGQADQLAS